MKRILAVGAFERDNFGDLLFLRLLRDFMQDKDVEITPASIIFSDMRKVNGEIVYPYALMLNLYKWDTVWIVGGEVGGVDITGAVLMDSIDTRGQHYRALSGDDKEAYNTLLNIPEGDNLSAYIPNLTDYDKNRITTMIVNSVGLSNSTLNIEMLKNEIDILSRSIVSVREEKSARFCEENNLHYTLSPDVVSTIAHFHPLKTKQIQEPYVVVQVNSELLSQTKLVKFAGDLKEISEHLGAKIILLRAGVTFGHDDSSFYEKIITKFGSLNPKYTIEQFEERDPLSITELIARSKLCIATSLHCRIVSESYDVPRISLSNGKVANYVATLAKYDPYPYDVGVNFLKDTVLGMKDLIDVPIKNNNLGAKALENLEKLYSQIKTRTNDAEFNSRSHDSQSKMFIEYVSGQKDVLDTVFTGILSEREVSAVQILGLANHTQELTQQIARYGTTIKNLENSKSYRIGLTLTAPYRVPKRFASRIAYRLKNKKVPLDKDRLNDD